jgi:histidyl-tRNA synthetase
MNAQMKYADRRRAPVAVIQGSNEKDAGEVTVKDLVLGKEMSKKIEDRAAWTEERPGQVTVKEDKLVETVRAMIARQNSSR